MARRFSFQLNRRLSALTRRRVRLSLQDGELWAGEMSRPAGFSPGRGACARGGCSARRCFALARRNDIPLYRIVNCAAARRLCLPDIVPAQGYRACGAVRRGDVVLSVCLAFGSCRACVPLGMSRVRFVPGARSYRNVLRSITPAVCRIAPNRTACGSVARFAFVHAGVCGSGGAVCRRSRRGLQFYCGVLPSVHAGRAVLLRCFAFGSRLSFFLCQEKRDGLRYLAFLFRRVEIAIRAFSQRSSVICLGGFTSGLCVYLWRSRRITGERRTGLAARLLCAFA